MGGGSVYFYVENYIYQYLYYIRSIQMISYLIIFLYILDYQTISSVVLCGEGDQLAVFIFRMSSIVTEIITIILPVSIPDMPTDSSVGIVPGLGIDQYRSVYILVLVVGLGRARHVGRASD